MTLLPPSGVFAVVRSYFADPQAVEHLRLTVATEHGPVALSPAEAHSALYGAEADPAVGAGVWQAAIRAAQHDTEPQGPWRLLLVWLALPRLSGSVYRICTRLRAARSDTESEMVLALLETLPTVAPEDRDVLLRAARSQAWRFARSARGLVPTAHIESMATDDRHPGADAPDDAADEEADGCSEWHVEVTPPDGPAGLSAPLHFTVPAARGEGGTSGTSADDSGFREVVRLARHIRRRPRLGTLSLRPRGRRR
ncbi:hypothetical protein [Streptomyces pinistramenti]|uniref:hypothetical protein n=1 Tax=Streptomyces pinistramenti TaxID=2884812 RepID=UPI001D08FF64|nr:hypothetical protein [Streptomyces pinistramenti]MCB5909661.1 hypothetical protein [Streptomyces pinistramenti]